MSTTTEITVAGSTFKLVYGDSNAPSSLTDLYYNGVSVATMNELSLNRLHAIVDKLNILATDVDSKTITSVAQFIRTHTERHTVARCTNEATIAVVKTHLVLLCDELTWRRRAIKGSPNAVSPFANLFDLWLNDMIVSNSSQMKSARVLRLNSQYSVVSIFLDPPPPEKRHVMKVGGLWVTLDGRFDAFGPDDAVVQDTEFYEACKEYAEYQAYLSSKTNP